MSATIKATGQCLCKSVSISAEAMSTDLGACHCNMCRKWSGGPFLAVDCQSQVTITGEENISAYNSSEWAERGFCRQCGTHLFYRLKDNNQYMIPIGFFDDDSQINFDHQIFIDEKPHYYTFANDTNDMTGQEVFAQFAPPE